MIEGFENLWNSIYILSPPTLMRFHVIWKRSRTLRRSSYKKKKKKKLSSSSFSSNLPTLPYQKLTPLCSTYFITKKKAFISNQINLWPSYQRKNFTSIRPLISSQFSRKSPLLCIKEKAFTLSWSRSRFQIPLIAFLLCLTIPSRK